ncbi:MAG: hypothetical protein HRT38_17980 [Alteromonadaceae bacterium]|nr:hypothetical protein [Alteromonadaceae bacterium]
MFELKEKSEIFEHAIGSNFFRVLALKPEEFDNLKNALIGVLPDYYVDPQSIAGTLARLGKPAAAQKLLTKIPEVKNIRSGDIGEVLATDYIE